MNISKENMYYTPFLGDKEHKKEKWTSEFLGFCKENKIITISILVFFLCVNVNLFLIFKFLKVLQFIK